MLSHGQDTDTRLRESGFTVLELMIVVAVMSVVLVIATGSLLSLTNTANRDETMVSTEQNASGVLAQLSRDIRSSAKITFSSFSTPQPANEVQLSVNKPGGGTTAVQWIYNSSNSTLTRYAQLSSGSFATSGTTLAQVANPSGTPVFSYYDRYGDLFTTTGSTPTPANTVANCTTRIGIQLYAAPPSGTTGLATLQETADVALTDQLAVLTTPGNGQC